MNNCGIVSRYRMPIHNIYKNATIAIQLQETTRLISIKGGVWHGDIICPKLFRIALEDVFNIMANMEINMNGRRLKHLRYAVDVLIIVSNYKDLQTILTEPTKKFEKIK